MPTIRTPPPGLGWDYEDDGYKVELKITCTGHSSIQWSDDRMRMFRAGGIEITIGMVRDNDKGCPETVVFQAASLESACEKARAEGWEQTGRQGGWLCAKHK